MKGMWAWSSSRKEEDLASSSHSRKSSDPNGSGGSNNKRNNIISKKRRQLIGRIGSTTESDAADASERNNNSVEDVHVSETVAGIEVSFSDELLASPLNQNGRTVAGMVSFREQIVRRRKIHRAQFSVSSYLSAQDAKKNPAHDFKSGKHRVCFFGRQSKPSFDDALFLLRSHQVRDEFSCVREELMCLNVEIGALETDRNRLEQRALHLQNEEEDNDDEKKNATTNNTKNHASFNNWDTHRLLLSSSTETLSQHERALYQEQRGNSLTVSLHNQQAKEAFLARCGSTASTVMRAEKHRNNNTRKNNNSNNNLNDDDVICLRPQTCRDGGAAATLQHVALLGSESAFFMSKDKGKSFCWGHLPDRLFRRMKNAGFDPNQHHDATDLLNLSTGPMGCYYAQFRSGECWWGSIVDDSEFDAICKDRDWDIHRVVFGAVCTITDALGLKHATTSWIVLGRDGRAAWKNLPSRLHNKLSSRLTSEAAPVEVALGSGGSYFVRFLDGTTDYCLPAKAAQVCKSLEDAGMTITSMSLHPELSRDFVIRHR